MVLFVTILFGVTLLAGQVDAKKKKTQPTAIVLTSIKSFDKVFIEAQKVNRKLKATQVNLRKSKMALRSALQLKKRSTYVRGLKELKRRARGKVKLFVNKGQLQLKATDLVPTDVKQGIDAVNQLSKTIPSSIRNLKGVVTDSQKMIKQVQDFPTNIQNTAKTRIVHDS